MPADVSDPAGRHLVEHDRADTRESLAQVLLDRAEEAGRGDRSSESAAVVGPLARAGGDGDDFFLGGRPKIAVRTTFGRSAAVGPAISFAFDGLGAVSARQTAHTAPNRVPPCGRTVRAGAADAARGRSAGSGQPVPSMTYER